MVDQCPCWPWGRQWAAEPLGPLVGRGFLQREQRVWRCAMAHAELPGVCGEL